MSIQSYLRSDTRTFRKEQSVFDFIIYADGACIGNPGPGGVGVVILNSDGTVYTECSGTAHDTTNNQMELCAVITALQHCPDGGILVMTDSEYVVKGMTAWIEGWKDNGWRNSNKKPVANKKLWLQLDGEVQARAGDVTWRWIDRNSPNVSHLRAHELAEKAARKRAGNRHA